MKSNRGVTLTSLIIYIIGLIIIIGIMDNFLNYFNKNVNEIVIKDSSQEQYSKFLAYLSKDTNSSNLVFVKTSEENDKDYIILKFKNGIEHQYIYQNNNIYYLNLETNNNKKILLCKDVTLDENESKVFNYNNQSLDIGFKIMNEQFSGTLSINI